MSLTSSPPPSTQPVQATTAKSQRGGQTRNAILHAAASLVTLRGLEGLSIGDLAAHLGISKSGLYAHFKSKEELQLATIQTAFEIFDREVLQPALAHPAGLTRYYALIDAFLLHIRRKVFPGGCFFAAAAAELATRPGAPQQRIKHIMDTWLGLIAQCLSEARDQQEISRDADIDQLSFETEAMLFTGNAFFVMSQDEARLTQARRGIERLIKTA